MKFSYNNKTISGIKTKSLIKIEFGLIQAPFALKNSLIITFNKCTEEFYNQRNTTIFHCGKSLDTTLFKNLNFILKDIVYEFVLSYKDLFIEKENEYLFSIVFDI